MYSDFEYDSLGLVTHLLAPQPPRRTTPLSLPAAGRRCRPAGIAAARGIVLLQRRNVKQAGRDDGTKGSLTKLSAGLLSPVFFASPASTFFRIPQQVRYDQQANVQLGPLPYTAALYPVAADFKV